MTFSIRHKNDHLPRALLDDLKAYVDAHYLAENAAPALFRKAAKQSARADAIAYEVCEDAAFPAPQSVSAASGRRAESLEDVLRQKESSFSEHLLSLLDECGEKDSAVYRRAQISRQLFHKILNNRDYQPTKSTAIQLALGLRLDLPKTQTLLQKAGYALTRSSRADLVVQYFIEHGEYSVVTINAALYDCGLPLLKTGSAL